ncbi:rhodanese-like domain-containing protein [Robiginitalea sp. M366]|uniref:rhodanese-like domain-containing protein n=1 Tax=Robiginitalea aestuariiviva TaxID=3036903 RepID=UPI00240E3104|nr:rhodanese-like domain-containing protein [Robiginitalea aestuariiviva]MDG1570715.1 rhodanese-like domain-containing protein [Robiginitalea aestuariiviva]
MSDLTQEQWAAKAQADPEAVILDVRTDQEVEEGIIPGAIHLDFYQGAGFLEEIDKLDKAKSYYVYCRSGNRSGQACALMQSRGFGRTYNLMGGMMEWEGDVIT